MKVWCLFSCILILLNSLKLSAQDCQLSLISEEGTDSQVICIGEQIEDIVYLTEGATDVLVEGLPAGITYTWEDNIITITGILPDSGIYSYIVTLLGDCNNLSAEGSITGNPLGQVNALENLVICNEGYTPEITFSTINVGGTTTYEWINDNPSIFIISFILLIWHVKPLKNKFVRFQHLS